MNKLIISDSCIDLYSKDLTSETVDFVTVPLSILMNDKDFVDDETLDFDEFYTAMANNKSAPKTACPSPEVYAEKMRLADEVFVITLSSKLSGSYNSACVARDMVLAEKPNAKIHVFDSLSAAGGQTLIAMKIKKLIETTKFSFEEIVEKINAFLPTVRVRFLLNDLGNLVKTGRIGKIIGTIANVLSIKLILGDNGQGEIVSYEKVLSHKKAVNNLSNYVQKDMEAKGEDMEIVISHCKNEEDANIIKNILSSVYGLKKITIIAMRGLSSFYANVKGLTVAY